MRLLERELDHLGARNAVIELSLEEAEIRIDGWPRASARPNDPGVVVSFDSKYGPLRYATAKKLHPDNGGDHDEFIRLQAAWAMLKGTDA